MFNNVLIFRQRVLYSMKIGLRQTVHLCLMVLMNLLSKIYHHLLKMFRYVPSEGNLSRVHSDEMSDDGIIQNNLKADLANWINQNRVPHVYGDKLLKILHVYHPELPLTTRTLVGTSRETVAVEEMNPGSYFHIGIEAGLKAILNYLQIPELNVTVKIFVGVDGVNLTKSSSSQFWVIVGYLENFRDSPPFVIGVYHGHAKPDDCNNFLRNLVEEDLGLYE